MSTAALVPVMAYCAASIVMTLTNKYVLTQIDFRLNLFLLVVQSAVCVLCLKFFSVARFVSHRPLNRADVIQWFPTTLLLCLMLYTGTKSLEFLSIPVFTIFKNLTIILIAYGEFYLFGSAVTNTMLLSFALMVVSAIAGGYTDIEFDLRGYVWMLLNCVCSAWYILNLRRVIKKVNFADFDSVYYNNLLSIPPLIIFSFLAEDWPEFISNIRSDGDQYLRTVVQSLVFSGISSFFISYTSIWCVRVTSSTTYSMIGALNKLPLAVAGMIFFRNPATMGRVGSVLLGVFGGAVYSYGKAQVQAQSQAAKEVLPMTSLSGPENGRDHDHKPS